MTTNEYIQLNRRFETEYFGRVKKALDSKVNAAIEEVKVGGVQAGISYLNRDLSNVQLTRVVRQLYTDVGVNHARLTERRLRNEVNRKKFLHEQYEVKGLGKNETWTKFILDYLEKFLIEKITFHVSQTTRNYLLRILSEATQEGWGLSVVLDKLESLPYTRFQAARIVRTEVNRAANTGFKAQAETFEYQLQKEWVSVHDKRTRGTRPEDHASHVGLDGVTIDMEDWFIDPRNGDQLQQPGDPEASGESTINCRCRIVTKPKRDQNDDLIPKRQSTTVIYPSQNRNRRQIVTI